MSGSDGKDDFRPVDKDRRLSSIDERLEKLQASEAERIGQHQPASADPNARLANRVLADLIGGIAGGALLGWLVDRWFETQPWGFLILLTLGVIVAFRNIFRIANGAAAASRQPGDNQ